MLYYYRLTGQLLTRRYTSIRLALKYSPSVRASSVCVDPFTPLAVLEYLEADSDALQKHVEQIARREHREPPSDIEWGYIS